MNNSTTYDCAIIGGGIAGLCLGIQLARKNFKIVLFEKHTYPFHKVCGEYVSNESRGFFQRLGLPLDEWHLPLINELGISSPRGYMMEARLEQGGFGLSRFKLDNELYHLARTAGVEVHQNCKVQGVKPGEVHCNLGVFKSKLIAGTFGKSNPVFASKNIKQTGSNYIGVKYHVRTSFADNRIELHNFNGGYCGISKIEAERYCLCYISDSENLKQSGNSIDRMEKQILYKNPLLEHIFTHSEFLFDKPVTISNISFSAKQAVDDQLFYLGDAAGCISPLTGNGMSMAARTSESASRLFESYLNGECSTEQLRDRYRWWWDQQFSAQIKRGRHLQTLFGKQKLTHFVLQALNPFSSIKGSLIRSTHGDPF